MHLVKYVSEKSEYECTTHRKTYTRMNKRSLCLRHTQPCTYTRRVIDQQSAPWDWKAAGGWHVPEGEYMDGLPAYRLVKKVCDEVKTPSAHDFGRSSSPARSVWKSLDSSGVLPQSLCELSKPTGGAAPASRHAASPRGGEEKEHLALQQMLYLTFGPGSKRPALSAVNIKWWTFSCPLFLLPDTRLTAPPAPAQTPVRQPGVSPHDTLSSSCRQTNYSLVKKSFFRMRLQRAAILFGQFPLVELFIKVRHLVSLYLSKDHNMLLVPTKVHLVDISLR